MSISWQMQVRFFFVIVWSCLWWVDDFYVELLKQQLQHRSQLSTFNILAPDFLSNHSKLLRRFFQPFRFASARIMARLGGHGILPDVFQPLEHRNLGVEPKIGGFYPQEMDGL